ncbi:MULTISPECIES: hypothetical protein [unclassified Pseudomonas]|uniref:hypothetical protein n=1 Tax=unclassified Pseudomonas TaxID=196821 RepID=UPI0013E12394|nr:MULTISPECIES: hypothetical protein [unclassified Pseudomonas]QIH05131.1 hypothetical protein ATY02_05010 [Pseudomonas sp. BIOMIG1BAC]
MFSVSADHGIAPEAVEYDQPSAPMIQVLVQAPMAKPHYRIEIMVIAAQRA